MKSTKKTAKATHHAKTGVKSQGGVYRGSVVAEERDQTMRRGSLNSEANRQTEEIEGGTQRVSDGQQEDYSSNTASELNRQQ